MKSKKEKEKSISRHLLLFNIQTNRALQMFVEKIVVRKYKNQSIIF